MEELHFFKGKRYEFAVARERSILVACMVLAAVFWFVLKMSKTYTSTNNVYLSYVLPQDKAFSEIPREVIEAELTGTGWNLMYNFFASKRAQITFDLDEIRSDGIDRGEILDRIEQTVYDPLQVSGISVGYIPLNYEDRYQKKVPVVFDGMVLFEPGYGFLDSIVIYPDSVEISGPKTMVEEYLYWYTNTMEMDGLKESFSLEVRLQAPLKGEISLQPKAVQVDIKVEEFTEKTIFVPVKAHNAPDSIRIFPSQIQLQCVVGLSKFNDIQPEQFELVADFTGIPRWSDNNTVPISLQEAPKEVRAINCSPKSVEFFIQEAVSGQAVKED